MSPVRPQLLPVGSFERFIEQVNHPVDTPPMPPPDEAPPPPSRPELHQQAGHQRQHSHHVRRSGDGDAGDGDDDADGDEARLLALVDDLAALAADLYLDGKLSADSNDSCEVTHV